MVKPQHETAEYRRTRKALAAIVERGEAWCVEPICLMPTRWIAPGSKWDTCHTPDGQTITGPGHARCNRSEAATRGNRARRKRGGYPSSDRLAADLEPPPHGPAPGVRRLVL